MADRVPMKALDTMHISNAHAENLNEGDVFLVSEAEAKHLEDRGLAERGGKPSDAVNARAVEGSRPDSREDLDAERGDVKPISAEKAPAATKEASKPKAKRA